MTLFPWILALTVSAASPAAENLCTNGSFEELARNGFPADWGAVGKTVEVTGDAHTGRRALRFVRAAGTDPRTETGLNRVQLIDRLRGGVEFWYKAVSAQDANLRIYAIPVNSQGIERTGAGRAAFTVPAGEVGDGQWHRGRFKYDFTANPEVKSLHFAVRIEGTAGELLVDDFAHLERVGPVLRFGTVRLEEDPQRPGARCRVHVPIHNDGDAAAEDVRAVLAAPAGLVPTLAECRVGNLAPGKMARARWTLDGERLQPGELALRATSGSEQAATSFRLRAALELVSWGAASPVVPVGRPMTLQAVLKNTGQTIVEEPVVRFEFLQQHAERGAARIRPGESLPFRAEMTPPRQCEPETLEVAVRAKRKVAWITRDRVPTAAIVAVGAATPPPSPGGAVGATATAQCAVLENEHVRLIFRNNDFGFGPGELMAKTAEGWRTVAWLSRLGGLVCEDRGQEAWSGYTRQRPRAEIDRDRTARLEFAASPEGEAQAWKAKIAFELRPGDKTILCRYELDAQRPRRLLEFRGPMLEALQRDEAVYPGVEWLVEGETSSSTLDIAASHRDRDRRLVHPNYVTIPAIGIHASTGTVGLLWDARQKWDGTHDRPQPQFDSPNILEGCRTTHFACLSVPRNLDLSASSSEVEKPYPLQPGKPLHLECRILADGTAADALTAIDHWVRLYGIPQPAPIPRGSYEKEIEFSMQAYLKSLWAPEEKTWWTSKGAGPILSPKGRPPSYVADLLVGGLLSPGAEVRKQCRARAEEVVNLIGGEPRLDAMRFPGRTDLALANPMNAAGLLASRGDDGTWRFDADLQAGPPFEGMDYYELGPDDAVELGTCAQKAFQVLRYARIAGDWDAYRRMRKTLERMETFRVPRAAQVWEVPVHTPDILAAADAVDAFVEAYRFSGDERWLRDAVSWARRGLPFVYLWQDPDRPFLLGASIPVFGASWYTCSWFGRPVQWNGLRYAGAILKLDGLDRSYPWRQIAELLVHSAMHQQDPAGENAALWPDNISAVNSEKCPWVFAPRMILEQVLTLLGRSEEPATVILGQGEKRLHVTAPAKIAQAAWDGRTCSFTVTYPPGEQGVVLVANVGRPAAVLLGDRPLGERAEVEKGREPGWRYDVGLGILSIRVDRDGPSAIRIEGAAFRHVDRLPAMVDRIAFEFNDSAEGWTSAHHVGPLEVRDGALCGPITGGDPYLVRGVMRVRGDSSPVVLLRMRVTAGQGGQLYWSTESSPGFSEDKVLNFPVQADGRFHEYRLELGKHSRWAGQTITALRIDPGNGAAAGEFALDYLRGQESDR